MANQRAILFKYLDFEGAKAMLSNSNIQFTNATKLNDPFDCHPGLIDFTRVTPKHCKGWPPSVIEELKSHKHIRYRERAWICCLSKVFDSILMWSYYNGHKGVCIGLDIEKVREYIQRRMPGFSVSSYHEVTYGNIIEKPDYFADTQDYFMYQLTTKARDWEHEQEVRMFILDPSPMYMRLPYEPKDKNEVIDWKEVRSYPPLGSECFSAIYLGVNIDKKDKEEIIKISRKLNSAIHIYQMEVNPDAFKLDSCEIV